MVLESVWDSWHVGHVRSLTHTVRTLVACTPPAFVHWYSMCLHSPLASFSMTMSPTTTTDLERSPSCKSEQLAPSSSYCWDGSVLASTVISSPPTMVMTGRGMLVGAIVGAGVGLGVGQAMVLQVVTSMVTGHPAPPQRGGSHVLVRVWVPPSQEAVQSS